MTKLNIDEIRSGKNDAPPVRITSFRPDFENPDQIPRGETNRILKDKSSGVWYLNPVAKVYSPVDSDQFLSVVMKRQADWFRHLSRQFKNQWRFVRNQAGLWEGAYEFDGVIIQQGVVLPFEIWKGQRQPEKALPQSVD